MCDLDGFMVFVLGFFTGYGFIAFLRDLFKLW